MSQRWVDVGRADDLKFTPGAAVRVEDKWIAIFRQDGAFLAIDNACPHAGAPLCDGSVQDGKVICFLHVWEFDLRTGQCDMGSPWNVRSYAVREHEGKLQIAL